MNFNVSKDFDELSEVSVIHVWIQIFHFSFKNLHLVVMPRADNFSLQVASVVTIYHLLPLFELLGHLGLRAIITFLFCHNHSFLTLSHHQVTRYNFSTSSTNLVADLKANEFIFGKLVHFHNNAVMS